jgi:hypothetical protein
VGIGLAPFGFPRNSARRKSASPLLSWPGSDPAIQRRIRNIRNPGWPRQAHGCPVRFTSLNIRLPLDVTPESALALIRGLPQYFGSSFCEIPDNARKAHFRDDDVENIAELNRTAVRQARP